MRRRIERVTPQAAALMAGLHAQCFDRPWNEREFAALLYLPGTTGLVLHDGVTPCGLALLRQAADEAEVLTIGIAPGARRHGSGARLLAGAEGDAARAGVKRVFLEVSTANAAAQALYDRAGYSEIGRRRAYYADGTDALVLEKWLRDYGQTPM